MVIVSSCAVSSTPAELFNLFSYTDALEGLAGDSCALNHNSSWVKFAEIAII